jgi:hypothetical protein
MFSSPALLVITSEEPYLQELLGDFLVVSVSASLISPFPSSQSATSSSTGASQFWETPGRCDQAITLELRHGNTIPNPVHREFGRMFCRTDRRVPCGLVATPL